jgi:hypothetical protein
MIYHTDETIPQMSKIFRTILRSLRPWVLHLRACRASETLSGLCYVRLTIRYYCHYPTQVNETPSLLTHFLSHLKASYFFCAQKRPSITHGSNELASANAIFAVFAHGLPTGSGKFGSIDR